MKGEKNEWDIILIIVAGIIVLPGVTLGGRGVFLGFSRGVHLVSTKYF